jgi:hypothetical protein
MGSCIGLGKEARGLANLSVCSVFSVANGFDVF